jgi:hypothetical protein
MASAAQHIAADRAHPLSGLALSSLILEVAMSATHRRSSGDPARRGSTSLFLRGCESAAPGGCTSAARERDETALSETARIKWMLTALQAHHRGLALGAAMREADRDVGSFAQGRVSLPAFIDELGGDHGLSLAAQLRRLVLAQIVGALRRVLRRPFRSAPR